MIARRSIVAAALAAALAVPAFAQVRKEQIAGIRNYSRVDATVGCGGATDPSAMAALRREGFRSVINLRLASEPGAMVDEERAAAEAAGLRYIHLPFEVAHPDPKVVDSFLAAVADASNQPVYIHCGSASRVGGLWMIKRVLQDRWTPERALAEAKAIGLRSDALEAFAREYIAAHR